MKDWERVARQSSQSRLELGLGLGSRIEGRRLWIVDAHGYEKRFIVRAEEILTAFLELDSASRAYPELI